MKKPEMTDGVQAFTTGGPHGSQTQYKTSDGKVYADIKEANAAQKKLNKAKAKADYDSTFEVGGVRYDDRTGAITDITPGSEHEGQRIAQKDASKPDGKVTVADEVGEDKYLNQALPTNNTSVMSANNPAVDSPTRKNTEVVDQKKLDEKTEMEKNYDNIRNQAENTPDVKLPDIEPREQPSSPEPAATNEQPEQPKNEQSVEQTANEIQEDPDKLTKFWNAFKAGAFASYPYLQAVAQQISNNAKMTMDRAGLLTGGQRFADAYDVVNPEDYKDDNYNAQYALAAAKNGNMDLLAAQVANGAITLENAAAAMNMTPEDLQTRFSQTMRGNEAETQTKELSVEETKQKMSQDTISMIQQLEDSKTQLEEMKRSLAGHDYDAFSGAVTAYRNALGGIKQIGSAYTTSQDSSSNIDGGLNAKVVSAGAGYSSSNALSNTATSSVDSVLMDNMNKILNDGADAMKTQDKANDEFIKSIDARIASIDEQIAVLKKANNRLNGTTTLNYSGASTNAAQGAK